MAAIFAKQQAGSYIYGLAFRGHPRTRHDQSQRPLRGTSNGKHRPLSEESKAYIEKFGIPYGSW
ncbi:hypothetical protein AF70_00035960 [Pseudomonas sp. KD5]|uniref:Uncharacterized protein n=1 Tax=Pseudomonas umsongensis TaxID=198618 RepID=A0ACC5MJS3_9PSED|nr:hypothetical protein [Pseudomonas umsongensis]NMN78027.1 hypothetical protein [Pseudomonas sp. KD5]